MGLSLSDRFASMRKGAPKQHVTLAIPQPSRGAIHQPNSPPRNKRAIRQQGPNTDIPRVPNAALQKINERNGQFSTSQMARAIAFKTKEYMEHTAPVKKNKQNSKSRLNGYTIAAITQALVDASSGVQMSPKRKGDFRSNQHSKQNIPSANQSTNTSSQRKQVTPNNKPVRARLGVQARLGKKLPENDLRVQSEKLQKNKFKQINSGGISKTDLSSRLNHNQPRNQKSRRFGQI